MIPGDRLITQCIARDEKGRAKERKWENYIISCYRSIFQFKREREREHNDYYWARITWKLIWNFHSHHSAQPPFGCGVLYCGINWVIIFRYLTI